MIAWPSAERSPELSCWNGVVVGWEISQFSSNPLVSLSITGSCFTDISPDLNHSSDQRWWPFSYRVWAAFFPSHFPSSLHISVTKILKTVMLNCRNHSLLEKEIPASITELFPFWPNGWGSESLLAFCRCLDEDRMTHKPCSSSILRSHASRKLSQTIGEAKSTSRFTCLHGSIC